MIKSKPFESVIGLEIHVQLKTKSKMFCSCDNNGENKPINTTTCPICTGQPGTLPNINKEAIISGLKAALALNCQIAKETKFDRKNYFYPDLPKGYQISQYDKPLAQKGWLETIDGKININRLHLEEDAAKLQHEGKKNSVVDFNRAGTPLIEIVTEPDIKNPQAAKSFLQDLRLLMRYLKISDADMEKGHLRCDANVSLRPHGDKKLYPKTEIKNLNSFKSVERALEYEIQRQTKLWLTNTPPVEESTRGWDDKKQVTLEQRSKEGAQDYRYFPEPDLPPLVIDQKLVKEVKNSLPELPQAKQARFIQEYDFSPMDARTLVNNNELADYTEQVVSELKAWLMDLEEMEGSEQEIWEKHKKKLASSTANWLINKLGGLLTEKKLSFKGIAITPENFAEFITLIYQGKINSRQAQDILKEMLETGADPSHIMDDHKMSQLDNEEELLEVIRQVIENNPQQAEDYKKGKVTLLKYFVGQVMKETQGRAEPVMAEKLLKKELKK